MNPTRQTPIIDTDQAALIAKVAHEANRALCEAFGDASQLPWHDAPQWQRDSCISGVMFHAAHQDAGPEASHNEWMRVKREDGWVWGPTKDVEAKEHPCMVPFNELPVQQQAKDHIFRAIVHALMSN